MHGIVRAVFVLSVAFGAAIYMNVPDGGSVQTVLSNAIKAAANWDRNGTKEALGVPAPHDGSDTVDDYPTNLVFTKAGAPAKKTPNDAYIAASWLNLRAGPSTDYEVLEKLPFARKVRVVSRKNGWVEVTGNGDGQIVTGWVSQRYLSSKPPTVRLVSKSKPKRKRKAAPAKRPQKFVSDQNVSQ